MEIQQREDKFIKKNRNIYDINLSIQNENLININR